LGACAAAVGLAFVLTACAPPAVTVEVRSPASPSHTFPPSTIHAPAWQAFRLVYRNDDPGAEHDIAIYDREGGKQIAVSQKIVGPGTSTELVVPALAPGTYFVQCDIHPFMTAALIVSTPAATDRPTPGPSSST
jgi:plastocyanin